MSLPRWDDEMKFELLRLKTELKPENFRALHRPIGLGISTKKNQTPSKLPHLAPKTNTAQVHEGSRQAQMRFRPQSITERQDAPRQVAPSFSQKLLRLLAIHTLDILFVVITLGVGLLAAAWILDPASVSTDPLLLKEAAPVRILLKSKGFMILLGVYGFFSVYWLFFKIATGATLGESFLGNFRNLQNTRDTRSIKDSGDS